MCPVVIKLIMNMYINQEMQIKWNSMLSSFFPIANGVKQGGVMSPVLFNVYMNDLINILKERNIGCKVANRYMGIFPYANDLSLICPKIGGMKQMLNTCEIYASDFNRKFNASKSKMMASKCSSSDIDYNNILCMRDVTFIEHVTHCEHLGNYICENISTKSVDNAIRDL